MNVKGREPGPDDAEAVLDLLSLDQLAEVDRDRYTMVGIDLRIDGPTTAIATVSILVVDISDPAYSW
jgi:hypothetical protein